MTTAFVTTYYSVVEDYEIYYHSAKNVGSMKSGNKEKEVSECGRSVLINGKIGSKNGWCGRSWAVLGLGMAFLAGQFISWTDLVSEGVFFVGNPAGSFIYILTGMHGVHIVSALVFIIFVLVAAYRFKIHSRRIITLEMCWTYWHFLGGLWLYLYIFLLLNH